MILVNQSVEPWCDKYGIDVKVFQCDGCDRMLKTEIPFITKDFVGLKAPECKCGEARHTAMVLVSCGMLTIE